MKKKTAGKQLICLVLQPHNFQNFRNPKKFRDRSSSDDRMIGRSGKAKEKRSVAVEAVSFQAPEIPTGARLAERYPA